MRYFVAYTLRCSCGMRYGNMVVPVNPQSYIHHGETADICELMERWETQIKIREEWCGRCGEKYQDGIIINFIKVADKGERLEAMEER